MKQDLPEKIKTLKPPDRTLSPVMAEGTLQEHSPGQTRHKVKQIYSQALKEVKAIPPNRGIKLYTNNRKISEKFPNIWNETTLLSNPWVREGNTREFRKDLDWVKNAHGTS